MPPNKLNSMRLLEQSKIPYEAIEYNDELRDAEEVAEAVGVPPELVYKTLVVEGVGEKKPVLAILACNRVLDLKKLAVVMGVKKASLAAHKDAEAMTGLKVGGISALALTQKNWSVYLDQPAMGLEHILMSAGQRGTQLRVPTAAFIRLVRAKVADISADKPLEN